MNNSSPASTSLYPLENPQKIYREEALSRTDSDVSTFANRKTSAAESISEQIDTNSHNSLDGTSKLLIGRKIQNLIQQQKIIKSSERNLKYAMVLIVSATAFIVSMTLTSPFFAIGLALSVTAAIILLARSYYLLVNHDRCGIQQVCIDMLLAGIKNNIPDNGISLEDNTKLLNILEKVVNSLNNEQGLDLINNVRMYNKYKNYKDQETEKQTLTGQIKDFYHLVFDNTELTAHLEKLGFNVDAVQNDIYAYIENSTLYRLSKDIMKNMLLR